MVEESLVGIVTVTYNSGQVLLPFLSSLSQQTHGKFLLFAVDNASKDSTISLLNNFPDERFITIANRDNVGIAEGNNQGISAALEAGCSSILLLNNDTEFEPQLLQKLLVELETRQVQMTCPKIMFYDDPKRIWAAGGTFQPKFGYRSVHYGEGQIDAGQFDEARLVTYVPTCCVLILREVFDKIGLMDPLYFVYVDDVDFMYRAYRAGFKLFYIPTAKLLHKVSSLTGQEESISMIRFLTRNRVYFLLKHLGVIRSVPYILLYQLHFLKLLMTGGLKPSVYLEKEKAVGRGVAMWRSSRS